jgi:HlyD family secretion protein
VSATPQRLFLWVSILLMGAAGTWVFSRSSGPDRLVVDVGSVTRRASFQSSVSASGEIVATRYADIGSSVMGKIISLPVNEGHVVRRGQLLARIDPVQAESDAAGAVAQVRALEAEQAASAEQVRAATADRATADARGRDADQQFARQRDLHQQGLISAAQFETARAGAEAAAAQKASAEAAIDRARRTLEAATGRVAAAAAQVRRASDLVAKTAIMSPMDGTVTRLRVREGEMVVVGIQNQPGTTLMTISDLSAIDAEVKVAEADVLRVKVGQPAAVTLEALPGRTFTGRVVEIGASALPTTTAAAREFKVVVRLDQPEPGLRPGLTGDAEIITAQLTDVLTVPLQSAVLRQTSAPGTRAERGESSGVFIVEGERVRFVPVTPGVIGGLDIEVSGVAEGTPIVVGPFQVLRDLSDGSRVRVTATAR